MPTVSSMIAIIGRSRGGADHRKSPLVGWKPVQVARAAGVEELLVVVQVEAVEVGALPAVDLLDAQDLPAPQLERLAGARLDDRASLRTVLAAASDTCNLRPVARRKMPRREFAERAAHQVIAAGRFTGLDRLVDQFELLLVEPQPHNGLRSSSFSATRDALRLARGPCQVRASSPWGPAWSSY